MKRFHAIIFLFFMCATAWAQPEFQLSSTSDIVATAQPKHEVRAVWLTTIGGIDWPHSYAQSAASIRRQQQELCQTLDRLQRIGINTVLLQTRIRATTIYPSALEPWDGCLSGKPGRSPGYDALQFAIGECHRRGMELHAWVVTIPVGKWNAEGCRRLRKSHPELLKRIGQEGYMNPEAPGTANYLADICAEITRAYDVDGIHLDYIRYPETWQQRVSKAEGRDCITRIVRQIHRRVKALKPWVKLSCSPIGKHDDLPRQWSHGWNARTTVCQDAQAWLQEGLMDMLFPMMYFRGQNFYPFAADWQEASAGRMVCPGLGIYFLSPREKNWPLLDISREMEVLRAQGMGQAYFRSKFLTDNTKGVYDYAQRQFYLSPALVPPMSWTGQQAPEPPSDLSLVPMEPKEDGKSAASVLSWSHAQAADTLHTLFNIYVSRELPVDISRAENLMLTNYRRTSLLVPSDASLHYAVTATNRYGLESLPLQEPGAYEKASSAPRQPSVSLLSCDGRTLLLPEKAALVDASYLSIETLQGTIATVLPRQGRQVDVSRLPVGHYTVHTLGRKGVTHNLGHFAIAPSSRGL